MSKSRKKENVPYKEQEVKEQGKTFDICSFKVPIIITTDEDGNKLAQFEEVPMKDRCFRIELIETTDREDAIQKCKIPADWNIKMLKLYAATKNTGDLVTRKTITNHGKVTINTNINN